MENNTLVKFLVLFLILYIACKTSNKGNKSNCISKIDVKEWSKDTLGYYGYRRKILKYIDSSMFIGRDTGFVTRSLGIPDFVCYDSCIIYEYNVAFKEYKAYKYKFKVKDNCKKNYGLGSVYFLIFDKKGKYLYEGYRAEG